MKKIILSVVLVCAMLLVGCSEMIDPTKLVISDDSVKSFLDAHPNSDVVATHFDENETLANKELFDDICQKDISPGEYYIVNVEDKDTGRKIISVVDMNENMIECVKQFGVNSTIVVPVDNDTIVQDRYSEVLVDNTTVVENVTTDVPVDNTTVVENVTTDVPADNTTVIENVTTDVPVDNTTVVENVTTDVPVDNTTVVENVTTDVPVDNTTVVENVTTDVPVDNTTVVENVTTDVPVDNTTVIENVTTDVPVDNTTVVENVTTDNTTIIQNNTSCEPLYMPINESACMDDMKYVVYQDMNSCGIEDYKHVQENCTVEVPCEPSYVSINESTCFNGTKSVVYQDINACGVEDYRFSNEVC